MVCFSCEWLHAWSVSAVVACMHGQFQLWVVACMVSFSCEFLHAWSVSAVSGCIHGQFQLWVVACMVSLGCEWLHVWSVSVLSCCFPACSSCNNTVYVLQFMFYAINIMCNFHM